MVKASLLSLGLLATGASASFVPLSDEYSETWNALYDAYSSSGQQLLGSESAMAEGLKEYERFIRHEADQLQQSIKDTAKNAAKHASEWAEKWVEDGRQFIKQHGLTCTFISPTS